jgi:hypothetical protein
MLYQASPICQSDLCQSAINNSRFDVSDAPCTYATARIVDLRESIGQRGVRFYYINAILADNAKIYTSVPLELWRTLAVGDTIAVQLFSGEAVAVCANGLHIQTGDNPIVLANSGFRLVLITGFLSLFFVGFFAVQVGKIWWWRRDTL